MQREYVRVIEGVYRVGDTRVSLDSLIYLFREGLSAESTVESYPALTLEPVHGALASCLGNQNVGLYISSNNVTSRGHSFVSALLATPIRRYGMLAHKKIKVVNASAEIRETIDYILDENTTDTSSPKPAPS